MNSLFELVEYYKQVELKTPNYNVKLTFPVPRQVEYEDKPWYKKAMTRAEAEELVSMVPANGAYLVRESKSSSDMDGEGGADQRFAITFRYGDIYR